jgi:hypothetical protein
MGFHACKRDHGKARRQTWRPQARDDRAFVIDP